MTESSKASGRTSSIAQALEWFEAVARQAYLFTASPVQQEDGLHPFDQRNIHSKLPPKVRDLFDDGHYAEATLTAFKYVDRQVARLAKLNESGYGLMMKAFSETSPAIALTTCATTSEKDEQLGFKFMFAGAMSGIRNPRGHEYHVSDSLDTCLDHLALASFLLRRVEVAGFHLS